MAIETDIQVFENIRRNTDKYFFTADMKKELLEYLGETQSKIVEILNNTLDKFDETGCPPTDDPEQNPGSKYDPEKYKRKPHNIWFFYKRINTDGTVFVREYIVNENAPISNGQMKSKVKELALNARKDLAVQNPKPTGNNNFTNTVIDRICYYVIFVDEQNWEFQKDPKGNPIVLFKRQDPKGNPCKPNFSFFKADTFKTIMGGGDERDALVMVNYMKKNAAGDELEDESHNWFFDFPQRVKFALPDKTDENGNEVGVAAEQPRLTIMIDPGGTNQGPPGDP